MFEKIKAWIKRKRETAREQQAADRLIKHIEQALGFELYEWQRLYIITGIWQPPEGRLHGRTTAYILRLLLDQTLWEQRKAQRLKRGLQQCRKRQQQWKVYKTGKERGVAWAAP